MESLIGLRCPNCGEELDGAQCESDPAALPEPGDSAVCLYCAVILVYEAADTKCGLQFRKMGKRELKNRPVVELNQILGAQRTIRKLRAIRN